MNYVISDIHGCYEQYMKLLDKIHFSERDTLYLLGDLVDRGPEPMEVVKDVMRRKNVVTIMGNHDYRALRILERFDIGETPNPHGTIINSEDLLTCKYWIKDGGKSTVQGFLNMSLHERSEFLDYFRKMPSYQKVTATDKTYILVHGGIRDFEESKPLEQYKLQDFIYERTDYERRYYSDPSIYLVTGHTPTQLIRKDMEPLIYKGAGHIAVDCGCVFGGNLAAYCLETGECTYVEGYEK